MNAVRRLYSAALLLACAALAHGQSALSRQSFPNELLVIAEAKPIT